MTKLAKVVPGLSPERLHRAIQSRGLEASADIVELATPEQLARVFDLDLWRVPSPGAAETFDADRFGVWLSVLLQLDPLVAANKLAGLDLDLVVAGFCGHIRVFDSAALAAYTMLDGQDVPEVRIDGLQKTDIGGYVIAAHRISAWDEILAHLTSLETVRPEYFHRLMRGCIRLSSGGTEEDGFHESLHAAEQHLLDLSFARETRQEQQGYVAPAQAHAFLREARDLKPEDAQPRRSAIAEAYFRALGSRFSGPASGPGLVRANDDAFAGELAEIGFLVNVTMAGCTVQDRPLTPQEALECAAGTRTLGLEYWPAHWENRDAITAFQLGRAILQRDVCMFAARRLMDVVAGVRSGDGDVDLRLEGLRRQLARHIEAREPWRARPALDVILMLDAPAWAALLGLIDACPVVHAALNAEAKRSRTIDPAEFAFISQKSQIAAIHEFMASLPSVLAV